MVFRLTVTSPADATNVRLARLFHLYRGFRRRSAAPGSVVRASARRVTPPRLIYRSFKVKIYKKGDVARFLVTRTRRMLAQPALASKGSSLLTLKRGLIPRSKYIYGCVARRTLQRKHELLFPNVISRVRTQPPRIPTPTRCLQWRGARRLVGAILTNYPEC